MSYLRLKHDANASVDTQLAADATPDQLPQGILKQLNAKRLARWKKPAVKAVAFAKSHSADVLGITGVGGDSGADDIAAAIARTYSDYGQRILLLDSRGANIVQNGEEAPMRNLLNLDGMSSEIDPNFHYVRLENVPALPHDPQYFRAVFEIALQTFHAIIVTLPCAGEDTAQPSASMLAVGAACKSVFLVCVTGRTTRQEVEQCLASSKISDTRIDGILLNDRRLPMSRMLMRNG